MKQPLFKFSILILLLVGLTFIQSCEEHECPECVECPEEPELHTLFDTLRGEWQFIYSTPYWGTKFDPFYPVTIHFLSMNVDSSINYVTLKNDSIKKSGSFTVEPFYTTRKMSHDILVNPNPFWSLRFDFITKDTMRFSEIADDADFYFYAKVNP